MRATTITSLSCLLLFLFTFVGAHKVNASSVSHVIHELKPKLSPDAHIFLRGTAGYEERTERWQYWNAPDVEVVVEVSIAGDVAETISFVNSHNIPLTAQSGGHGSIASLGTVQNGVQIHMRRLNSLSIHPDGNSATIGGGATVKEIRDKLWEAGKQTVHGMCECPGVTSVALGGGHGILQGKYGLGSDQILSLDLVLANGTSITVSTDENEDLFWAMQGAGHNYGIVTSLEYRIYQIPDGKDGGKIWSHEGIVWEATTENVKKVFGIAKEMLDDATQPDGLMLYGLIMIDPTISLKPVIIQHVLYNGPPSTLRQYTKPYHSLNPVTVLSNNGTYPDYPAWIQVAYNSIPCNLSSVIPGAGLLRFPVDTKTHNLDALATMTETFSDLMTTRQEFAGSFVMIEQYPNRAVRAIEESRSAIPWRHHNLLVAPALAYPSLNLTTSPPTRNHDLDEIAVKAGEEMRQILVEGAEANGGHYSYVNYAYGGETQEEMYGEKNVGRLRELKKMYDPQGRFGFYAPVDEVRRRDEL